MSRDDVPAVQYKVAAWRLIAQSPDRAIANSQIGFGLNSSTAQFKRYMLLLLLLYNNDTVARWWFITSQAKRNKCHTAFKKGPMPGNGVTTPSS